MRIEVLPCYPNTMVPRDDDEPGLEEWIAEFCSFLEARNYESRVIPSDDVLLMFDLGISPAYAANHIQRYTNVLQRKTEPR